MRTIIIHPDAVDGGWDLLDDQILPLNQSFARRAGIELPRDLPGRHGEFMRAAQGGKNIKEISKIMNISPRRVVQILHEMLANPEKLKEEIRIEKNALFQLQTNDLQRPKKSRRGRPAGKKTPRPGQQELFQGGAI